MFVRIKKFRYLRGFQTKNHRDFKEEPNPVPRQPMSSEIKDEHQCSRKQEIHNPSNSTETVSELFSINHQTDKIQERAVIQKTSSLHSVDVPATSNLKEDNGRLSNVKPRLFIMHAYSDYDLAEELARRLRENGCVAILSGDIQDDLEENHCKALMSMQEVADFTVPVLTKTLVRQIYHRRIDPYEGDNLEREANCFMYNLALKEFSRAYCANYRVRPVCNSYEIANKVGNDPILQWCFRLWDEIPNLVDNLKNTKKYFFDSSIKTSKYLSNSTKVESTNYSSSKQTSNRDRKHSHRKIPAENNSNLAADKVALLIANQTPGLTTPAKDAAELAELLRSMDFKVIVVRDLSTKEMENVIKAFCSLLIPNSYALFFFAGHGLEKWGQTYLLPVDYNEKSSPDDSICKEYILKCMQEKETALNVLVLDCCRKLPSRSWEISDPIIVTMDKNTVYVYATTFSNPAHENKGKNSFFVKHLKKYICDDTSIQDIIFQVQKDSNNERLQSPVMESSLSMLLKLCDEIENITGKICSTPWEINQEKTFVDFPDLKCRAVLKIRYQMNGIYIYAWLDIKEDANLNNFLKMKINIEVSSVLQVYPSEGVHLGEKNLHLKQGNFLFKKKIVGLPQMKNQFLKGNVLFNIDSNVIRESEFFCIWLGD